MNETKTEIGGNEAGRIDMGTEFRESFDHAAITSRYIEQSVRLTLETNPIERVIIPSATAPDEIKKIIYDRVQKSVGIWLDTYEAMLIESKKVAVDLMGYTADLAAKKRAGLK